MQQLIAFFMALLAFLGSLFGNVVRNTDKLDLTDYELVWSDEFDGSQLDPTKWNVTNTTSVRRGGYWNGQMAQVRDGELVITSKYLENGVNEGDPAGWYTTAVDTQGKYEPVYGYIEARCKLPAGYGLWSAFWMMNRDAMSAAKPDATYGGELDIFEAPCYGYDLSNRVQGAIHWGGYGSEHRSIGVYSKDLGVDIYNTYNTYGLLWTESEYIFYVNGKKFGSVNKSDFKPSQAPEYMILSVEFAGSDGVPSQHWAAGTMEDNGRDFVTEFNIDYVRVYQKK